MNSNPVIALSGPRCCGKSTIAQHLVERHGFVRIAFADALREIAQLAGDDLANDRMYLANLGSKLRELQTNFLIDVMRTKIAHSKQPIVIEDIRFPSEFEFCKSIDAVTIRLEIPEHIQYERLLSRDGKSGEDATELIACMDESMLDEIKTWDYTIDAVGDFRFLSDTIQLLSKKNSSEFSNPNEKNEVIA